MRLETTFGGAGVLHGDLTPDCAAVVTAVLDALSAPAGAEDDRTREQRYHDALQEAMRRLVAAGLLPERAGQPVKVWAHMSLADLLRLDGSSALQEEWTAQVRAHGPRTAPKPPRPAATAGRGWTATPPRRSPATRPWPRSSPATSTRPCWRTWSGCAPNSASSATPTPARTRPPAATRPRPPAASPARPALAGHRPGPGSPRAGHHRRGRRPAVRPRRARVVPAPPPARRPPRRPQPAAGHRRTPRPSRPGSATR